MSAHYSLPAAAVAVAGDAADFAVPAVPTPLTATVQMLLPTLLRLLQWLSTENVQTLVGPQRSSRAALVACAWL